MKQISTADFGKYVDHTLLQPLATEEDIFTLCQEALEFDFFAVCVNPVFVAGAKRALQASNVKIATVCNFPLGSAHPVAVCKACEISLKEGADEIDYVLPLGAFKARWYELVECQIAEIKKACGPHLLKVILETCLLTPEEIAVACQLAENAGADFVKTSTGFSKGGASVEAVQVMRKNFSKGIKASGGIRNWEQALAMIEAGATRLGLSSSVSILKELSS